MWRHGTCKRKVGIVRWRTDWRDIDECKITVQVKRIIHQLPEWILKYKSNDIHHQRTNHSRDVSDIKTQIHIQLTGVTCDGSALAERSHMCPIVNVSSCVLVEQGECAR